MLDGYVTSEAAARDYGVVLTDDGAVDEAATRALRSEMKAKHDSNGANNAGIAEDKGGVTFTDLTKFATGVTT